MLACRDPVADHDRRRRAGEISRAWCAWVGAAWVTVRLVTAETVPPSGSGTLNCESRDTMWGLEITALADAITVLPSKPPVIASGSRDGYVGLWMLTDHTLE